MAARESSRAWLFLRVKNDLDRISLDLDNILDHVEVHRPESKQTFLSLSRGLYQALDSHSAFFELDLALEDIFSAFLQQNKMER